MGAAATPGAMPTTPPTPSRPSGPSHYDLLQLPATASAQELRRAFRRLSKHYHPDTTSLPAAQAEESFRQLQRAYAILIDPASRRAYDAALTPLRSPLPAAVPTVVTPPRPVPIRRALSGGEWFALLLLAVALALSLVLGIGMAWARGAELVHRPSWLVDAEPRIQQPPTARPGQPPAAVLPAQVGLKTAAPVSPMPPAGPEPVTAAAAPAVEPAQDPL